MPKKRTTKTSIRNKTTNSEKTIAILALLLNILVFPGLGTIIGGKFKTGIWQMILFSIGVALSFILIGIPIIVAVWIWALVSSIKILQEVKHG